MEGRLSRRCTNMSIPLALGTLSFLLAVIWGSPLIRWLRANRIGKQIRIEEPGSNQVKMGTPTMGGIMIVVPVVVVTVVLNIYNLIGGTIVGGSILVPLLTLISFAALGAYDDWSGLRGKVSGAGGMLGRYKILVQFALAFVIAGILYFPLNIHSIAIPTIPQKIDLGVLYIPIAAIIIVGFSNAVNFADGLDSLAGWVTAICFVAYGVIAYLQQQIYLVTFCFIMVGALLAFLWYNAHPAELFMGDVGSLALGSTLAVVALMTGQWLLLPLIGIIFVAEAVSVILQVGYFKLTKGKRIFKMTPIHYHFILLGWSETQVVQRFWLVGLLAAMLGVALALL
ncbi:MAG: phospho-N-acetylmuramoyl-pentapeptide-transferase [Chloroflexota bacterium]|nr:MAG: phospho-N-acetylmuramoyl-pentapeptide-transferase [Chloroflexota bacterium]